MDDSCRPKEAAVSHQRYFCALLCSCLIRSVIKKTHLVIVPGRRPLRHIVTRPRGPFVLFHQSMANPRPKTWAPTRVYLIKLPRGSRRGTTAHSGTLARSCRCRLRSVAGGPLAAGLLRCHDGGQFECRIPSDRNDSSPMAPARRFSLLRQSEELALQRASIVAFRWGVWDRTKGETGLEKLMCTERISSEASHRSISSSKPCGGKAEEECPLEVGMAATEPWGSG